MGGVKGISKDILSTVVTEKEELTIVSNACDECMRESNFDSKYFTDRLISIIEKNKEITIKEILEELYIIPATVQSIVLSGNEIYLKKSKNDNG